MNRVSGNTKILGDERHQLLIDTLVNATDPIPGRALGEMMNVSRQVIVGDITLLKAKGEPIIATNRGYLYVHPESTKEKYEKVIICRHTPEQTEEELNTLVDHGVTVKDVKIEHSVYGNLSATIMVANRVEVQQFLKNIQQTNAIFLLKLTECGIHLHTVSANSKQEISAAEKALKKAGILVD